MDEFRHRNEINDVEQATSHPKSHEVSNDIAERNNTELEDLKKNDSSRTEKMQNAQKDNPKIANDEKQPENSELQEPKENNHYPSSSEVDNAKQQLPKEDNKLEGNPKTKQEHIPEYNSTSEPLPDAKDNKSDYVKHTDMVEDKKGMLDNPQSKEGESEKPSTQKDIPLQSSELPDNDETTPVDPKQNKIKESNAPEDIKSENDSSIPERTSELTDADSSELKEPSEYQNQVEKSKEKPEISESKSTPDKVSSEGENIPYKATSRQMQDVQGDGSLGAPQHKDLENKTESPEKPVASAELADKPENVDKSSETHVPPDNMDIRNVNENPLEDFNNQENNEISPNFKTVNANDIDMSEAKDMDNPTFWNHHNNSKEYYMEAANGLPAVQDELNNGKTLDEIKQNPDLAPAVHAYYQPDTMVKVEENPDGSYSFIDDGRHRVAAAQELGNDMPVIITNADDNPTVKNSEPLSKNDDKDYIAEPALNNTEYKNLSDYMNAHNYGLDDYDEYSKDPQWKELYAKSYPDNTTNNKTTYDVDKPNDIRYNEYAGNIFNEGKLNRNYDSQSIEDANDILPDERISIERYTGDGYRDINKSLYDSDFKPSSDLKAEQISTDVNNISDCLDRKEIPYDSKMYRGLSDMSSLFGDDAKNLTPEELNDKYKGTYFQNDGFTSASTDKKIAERFSEAWDGGMVEMNVPKGANGMCLGEVGLYKNGEKEVLLQKGTVCRIDSVGTDDGHLYVKTTVIGR